MWYSLRKIYKDNCTKQGSAYETHFHVVKAKHGVNDVCAEGSDSHCKCGMVNREPTAQFLHNSHSALFALIVCLLAKA